MVEGTSKTNRIEERRESQGPILVLRLQLVNQRRHVDVVVRDAVAVVLLRLQRQLVLNSLPSLGLGGPLLAQLLCLGLAAVRQLGLVSESLREAITSYDIFDLIVRQTSKLCFTLGLVALFLHLFQCECLHINETLRRTHLD